MSNRMNKVMNGWLKPILIILLFLAYFHGIARAADTAISGLPEDTSLGDDSLIVTVDDPGGTPTTRKASLATLWVQIYGHITSTIGAAYDTAAELDALFAGKEDADATILKEADVDDTPVDGVTNAPVSSNWAYNHVAAADPHTGYMLESLIVTVIGDPGVDGAYPSEQAVREALNLKLNLSGGTLTGKITIDNLGAEFTEGDDYSDCSAFSSTGGAMWYDDSEGKFKKCQDGVLSDLDTNTGSATAFNNIATATGAGSITLGAYQHLLNLSADTSALRIGTSTDYFEFVRSGTNYIFRLVDGGSDGNIYADLGTFTVTTDGVHAQTGTTADDDMYLAAYDVDGTAYVNMLTLKAGNEPYLYLGPQTVGFRVDQNGEETAADGAHRILSDNNYIAFDATADGMDDDEFNGDTIIGRACGETLTQWDLVRLANDSDPWHQADANAAGEFPAIGISVAACTDTNAAIILIRGIVRNEGWTGLTPGGPVYLSTTAGGITQTAPSTSGDAVQIVGWALSDSEIYFDFSRPYSEVQ